jgi:hypothetical protein
MPQDTYSFVIRIWREAADSHGNVLAWRGSVDSVSNGERLHFDDLEDVPAFIRKQIGLTGPRPAQRQTSEVE